MTQRTIVEILEAVKARIEDPEQWCQNTYARNAEGHWVDLRSKKATRVCLDGAISLQDNPNHQHAQVWIDAYWLLQTTAKAMGYRSSVQANDFGGHTVVLSILNQAITLAKATPNEQ